jgi:ProP effector
MMRVPRCRAALVVRAEASHAAMNQHPRSMNHPEPTQAAAPGATTAPTEAADTAATASEAVAEAPADAPAARAREKKRGAVRAADVQPVLEQLASFYPQLFGAVFRPLKRGIFQELLDAHPDVFGRDALKDALAFHTRSTRYLTAVASGQPRHDLQGKAVEPMAPEHVHHALLEVFRRRQARGGEDLRPKLRDRIVQAFEASGLPREDYAQLVRGRDEAANALLDEALALAAERRAKDEALLRAFEANGGANVEQFAQMYGLDPRAAAKSLERARRST